MLDSEALAAGPGNVQLFHLLPRHQRKPNKKKKSIPFFSFTFTFKLIDLLTM